MIRKIPPGASTRRISARTGSGSSRTCSTDDMLTKFTVPAAWGSGCIVTSCTASVSIAPVSWRPWAIIAGVTSYPCNDADG